MAEMTNESRNNSSLASLYATDSAFGIFLLSRSLLGGSSSFGIALIFHELPALDQHHVVYGGVQRPT